MRYLHPFFFPSNLQNTVDACHTVTVNCSLNPALSSCQTKNRFLPSRKPRFSRVGRLTETAEPKPANQNQITKAIQNKTQPNPHAHLSLSFSLCCYQNLLFLLKPCSFPSYLCLLTITVSCKAPMSLLLRCLPFSLPFSPSPTTWNTAVAEKKTALFFLLKGLPDGHRRGIYKFLTVAGIRRRGSWYGGEFALPIFFFRPRSSANALFWGPIRNGFFGNRCNCAEIGRMRFLFHIFEQRRQLLEIEGK